MHSQLAESSVENLVQSRWDGGQIAGIAGITNRCCVTVASPADYKVPVTFLTDFYQQFEGGMKRHILVKSFYPNITWPCLTSAWPLPDLMEESLRKFIFEKHNRKSRVLFVALWHDMRNKITWGRLSGCTKAVAALLEQMRTRKEHVHKQSQAVPRS